MRFIANPIEIDAQQIIGIEPLEHGGVLDVGANFGLLLLLENGTKFPAGKELIARHVPSAGDFLVTTNEFVSIVPQEAFVQRYQRAVS
jgi:hypothetical protein